jgi:hypothetical protein
MVYCLQQLLWPYPSLKRGHAACEGGFKSFYFRYPDGHLAEVVEKVMWEV